ncbi:MAG: NHL repeat-containing protein [Candidatus Poribacteria bacterium]|nr:NHL repeat-containing protein [Candidatus Poribacteria bacterium]
MKKITTKFFQFPTLLLLTITLLFQIAYSNSAIAVDFITLEREFSGKGSSQGAFSKDIHLAFKQNIYVSDTENRLIQKLSPTGEFLFQIPSDPESSDNILRKPGHLTVDALGNIYVADVTTHHIAETTDPKIYIFAQCVHKFSPIGELQYTYFVDPVDEKPGVVLPVKVIIDENGKPAYGIQPAGHDRALRVAVNAQNQLFILDAKRGRIHKFAADGKKLLTFGRYGAGDGEFDRNAADIAVDARGNVFVADTGNHRVVKYDGDGKFVRSFGRKGRDNGEFVKPMALITLPTGEILVKDASRFRRKVGGLPEVIALSPTLTQLTESTPGQTDLANTITNATRPQYGPFAQNPLTEADTASLNRRLRLLEEAEYRRFFDDKDYDDDENQEELAEELKRADIRLTLFHNVISRIQKFDNNGRYIGRIIYETDQLSEEKHDLTFLDFDPSGYLYLRDTSDFTIAQYSVTGFTVKPSHMNGFYSARVANLSNEYLEDYEDIDVSTDVDDKLNQLELKNLFGWTYSLSERWHLTFLDELTYGEQDERYTTPAKIEDSFDFETQALENAFAVNLKYITNPNPYRYKELNLSVGRVDGTSDLTQDALFPDLNKQSRIDTGDANSTVVELNWDIWSRTNLWLRYADLNPAETSRNFIRRFYDVSGDLYEVFGSRNQARQFLSEFTIKF